MNNTPAAETSNTYVLPTGAQMLFVMLAQSADYWGGVPLLPLLNERQEDNLAFLKRKGLLSVDTDEDGRWVTFSEAGVELAAALGISLNGHPVSRSPVVFCGPEMTLIEGGGPV